MTRLRLTFLVFLSLATAFAFAGMDGYLILEKAKGQVFVRVGKRRWRAIRIGQVVPPGSSVRTAPNGEATFQLGSRLRTAAAVRSDEKIFRLMLSPNTVVSTHAPRTKNPRPLFEMVSGFMEQRAERGKLPVRAPGPIKVRNSASKRHG